jgi:hypothetical protein
MGPTMSKRRPGEKRKRAVLGWRERGPPARGLGSSSQYRWRHAAVRVRRASGGSTTTTSPGSSAQAPVAGAVRSPCYAWGEKRWNLFTGEVFFSCLGNDTLLPKQLPECQGNSRVQSVVARASQPGLIDRPPRQVERDRVQARCAGPSLFAARGGDFQTSGTLLARNVKTGTQLTLPGTRFVPSSCTFTRSGRR